jgi:hypothetical protein
VTFLRCHTTTNKRGTSITCSRRQITGGVFVSGARPVHARLLRSGKTYAEGWSIAKPNGRSALVLVERRTLRHGTYTLRLRIHRHRRWVTTTRQITIS